MVPAERVVEGGSHVAAGQGMRSGRGVRAGVDGGGGRDAGSGANLVAVHPGTRVLGSGGGRRDKTMGIRGA